MTLTASLDPVDDLSAVLEDDRHEARRAAVTGLAISFMAGFIWAFSLWVWTDIRLSIFTPETAHLAASFFSGVIAACGMQILMGFPGIDDYRVGDPALARLAKTNILDHNDFQELKNLLRAQGYVTLWQVNEFIRGERRERERVAALHRPGAQALLLEENLDCPAPGGEHG